MPSIACDENDIKSELYIKGESCPHCHDKISDTQRERYREREHQIQLAKERGESHLGDAVEDVIKQRRHAKQAAKEAQRKQN